MASSSQALPPPRAQFSSSSATPAPPPSRSTSLLYMLRTGHHITLAPSLDRDDCEAAVRTQHFHAALLSCRVGILSTQLLYTSYQRVAISSSLHQAA